jgi:L-seryl-tRNA(Ser) seleniumtransferase
MAELRDLPKVDELARDPALASYPERLRVEAARRAVDQMRRSLLDGSDVEIADSPQLALSCAKQMSEGTLRTAINMSGVILHTGLGRARLAPSVAEEIARVAADHGYLELDDETGHRGNRQDHVRELLISLTGAEDAMVVNNAAAALVLALRTLAEGRDVLLSRGQMVEIGGSFRVPEIVKQSGCRLVEVGCTNKTHLSDYAVGEDTGAILVCHRSNFEIIGFTSEPTVPELKTLGVSVVDDMGTGCIVDLARFELPKTKTLAESISQGADVAIGSGDKLLGGPQAGLIVGRREVIEQMRKHPLARALRVDKLTIAGLAATLRLYVNGQEHEIPTLRYLARSQAEVKNLAERLAKAIGSEAFVEEGVCEIGGGSGPGMVVPSFRIGIRTQEPDELAKKLRMSRPGVVGRIERDIYWLDPRTTEDEEVSMVAEVVKSCLS